MSWDDYISYLTDINELHRIVDECRKRMKYLTRANCGLCSGMKLCTRCGPEKGELSVLAFRGNEKVCRQCRLKDRAAQRKRRKFFRTDRIKKAGFLD